MRDKQKNIVNAMAVLAVVALLVLIWWLGEASDGRLLPLYPTQ